MNSPEELAKFIDYTNLDNTSTKEDIIKFCEKADEYGFFSVVVIPCYVKTAAEVLKDSDVKIGTVVGFPQGFLTTEAKISEAKIAIKNGADEIDMVINIPAIKSKNYELIKSDIDAVKEAIGDKTLKIIIEDLALNNDEKAIVSKIINDTKAEFIKTSTGFCGVEPFFALIESLKIIKKNAPNTEMKASGGIKNHKKMTSIIAAGATRIGTSYGDKIIDEFNQVLSNHNMDPSIKTGPRLI